MLMLSSELCACLSPQLSHSAPVGLLAVQVQERLGGQQQHPGLLCRARCVCLQVRVRQWQQLPGGSCQRHCLLVSAQALCPQQLVVGQAADGLYSIGLLRRQPAQGSSSQASEVL